jgi:hypothetical protein
VAGLVACYASQAEAEIALRQAAESATAIDVLTVRGLGVFGLNDALLRDTFQRGAKDVRIRVLIMSLSSPYIPQRAAEIGETEAVFRHALSLGRDALLDVQRRTSCLIESRQYSTLPIWRIIKLGGRLFVSSYGESQEGHLTLMYELVDAGPTSLYTVFERVFNDEWARSTPLIANYV